MADYFVGDIQGCYDELCRLLDKVKFDPAKDQLCPVGDLIARGPASEKVAKLMLELGDSVQTVLGNHDLHFLSVYHGLFKAKKKDKLTALLKSSWLDEYVAWLAQQPLARFYPEFNLYLSHAGFHPLINYQKQLDMANFAMQKIAGKDQVEWLKAMYGDKTSAYRDDLTTVEQVRLIVNIMTRMRFLNRNASLEFSHKDSPENTPDLIPWFNYPSAQAKEVTMVFGHWASLLGKTGRQNVLALDTGCVWGNGLTAYSPQSNAFYFQEAL